MNHEAEPRSWGGATPFRSEPDRPARAGGRLELWLAVGAVFLAPFNILRVDAFYFTASDVLVVATLLARVTNRSFVYAPLGAATPLWNLGIMLLSVMLLASSLLHGAADRGVILWAQYCFAYLLLPYVVLARPWRETILLIKAFLASLVLMCLHGILVVDVLGERNTTFVTGSGRLVGFVERENECASLIAMGAPLALWLTASGSVRGWLRWPLLLLFAYGIALTGSNTGLIGLLLAIAAFTGLTASIWRIAVAAGLGVGLLMVMVTWGREFLPPVFQRRVLGALENGDIDQAGTFAGRMQLIHEAMGMADHSLLFGFGADQYRVVSAFHAPVHNAYLLIWVEAGLLGVIGFALILLSGVLIGITAIGAGRDRLAGACALTAVCLFAATANAFPHLYGRFFVVPLLLGLAPSVVSLNYGLLGRARSLKRRAPGRNARAAGWRSRSHAAPLVPRSPHQPG
ncbi:O-antigen ligase family protein [Aureimonas phyllosphaerae]|uniref:O-antigen ligase family protein n=1 Tax=Aureimonas phyllosphaerae TaxID=1166078 RepID=UPI003A5BCEA0